MQTFLQKIFVVVLLGLPAFCAFANTQYLYFDAKDAQTATRLLSTQKDRLGVGNNDEFRWSQTNTDDLGLSHQIYQQFYHNYRVENAVLKTHSRNNVLYLANGNWVRNLTQTPNITLTETQALARALQQVKATKYAWEDEATEKIAQQLANNPNATFYPTAELVWATEGFTARATDYRLCYRFDVFALQPMQRYYVYVDAQTGNIVTKTSLIHHSDTPCTGTASYACSNPVSIMAKKIGPNYYLSEDGNNGNTRRISTYSAQNNNNYYLSTEIISTDNVFNEDPTAVATHWATEKTYDYFKNTHGRNSFDNNNARMINFCHFDEDPADGAGYNNAFWNGSFLTYGDGNMYAPLVSIDVVAHEIAHAITQYSAGLVYSYEAGALNESFSDIFGTIVEFYADGTCANWLLGEDLMSGGLRNMQNPNAKQQPDTYHGNYWYAGSNDYGGVHANSGVQNYWFYLLANGGSGTNDQGTNYSVQALGMNKAAKITYRSLAVYLDATANYADARTASLQAAQDLLNAGQLTLAELQQVANAWCAVGVGTCTLSNGTIALTTPNGGETYQANGSQNIMWTSTGTLNAIDISYSIDGGNTWAFIANTPNTGSYTWAVPNISTNLAQIQLRDQYNSAITDQSNNNFSIQGCDIQAGFIADTTTACASTTLNFTNTTTGATTYQWKINSVTQSTSTNLSYNFTTEGIYTVQLTATNGTCSDTYTQTITVNPAPNAAFTHTENDLTFSGFATQLSADSYTWDFGDGTTSTTQNAAHTYTTAGTYNVCLTAVNGCGSLNSCQSVVVNNNNTTCWQTISAGGYHTIALKTDGTLWSWGENSNGQSGYGTNNSKNTPTQIGTDNNWQSVSAGAAHTIALKTDGTLWAWGANGAGYLGDGTTIDKNIPTQIGTDNNWHSISAGGYHTIALKIDGTLWAWGWNGFGQLGDGTTTIRNTPIQIGTDNNWQSISAGGYHTIALKIDGTLWAWGRNDYGQLGDGTTIDKNTPIQIGTTTNWQSISAGGYHTIALKIDGTLWAWGYNFYEQLGDGTTTDKNTPIQIGTATNWQSISAEGVHCNALKTDGTLWAWGWNYYGQLGDGTTINKNIPTQIGNSNNWLNISGGAIYNIALKTDGTLWAWGSNGGGQLGDGTIINKNTPTQIGGSCTQPTTCWQTISAGTVHTVALKTDGTLWAWGYGLDGQLGDGTSTNRSIRTQIGTDTDWQSVSTEGAHNIAIKTDGTLWAWGNNYVGQLGDGTNTDKNTPTQIGTDTDWKSVSAGGFHTIALKTDSTLWAWGWNVYNQLGDGTTTIRNTPTQIGNSNNWQSINSGYYHTIALKTDGTLWAWGWNGFGQLGDGTNTNRNTPTQIGTATNWQTIGPGYHHTIALKTDSTLWAWGHNNLGQLGDGTTTNKNTPTQIGNSNNWQSISGGYSYTIALKIDGTRWAWGHNNLGQLGDGTTTNKNTPTQIVNSNNWQIISPGEEHSVALKTDGTLWVWGQNQVGQLGDGTNIDKNTPTFISGCTAPPCTPTTPTIEWQNTVGGSGNETLQTIIQTTDGGYILGGYSNSPLSGDKTENYQGVSGYSDYWVVKLDATGQIIQWQNTIGGTNADELNSVVQTSDGGYLLGGTSLSGISGDKTEAVMGNKDYWVVKLDATGNIQWQNTIGGNALDELSAIAQTIDGGYILGGYSYSDISGDKTEASMGNGDYWVVKLDATGQTIQWQNTIGGSESEMLTSLAQTSTGEYILGGSSDSNISTDKNENSNGSLDYWVVKLDATGQTIQWQNTIGGSSQDELRGMSLTSDGGCVLNGVSLSNTSFDKTENCRGQYDYWVVKLDLNGTTQWDKTVGGDNLDIAYGIQQTTDGGYVFGGYSYSGSSGDKAEASLGSPDVWIVKLNTTGQTIEWQNTIGGSSTEYLKTLKQTSDGGYVLGAYSLSNISGDKSENSQGMSDYWVIKLSPDCIAPTCPVTPQFTLPTPTCTNTPYTFTNTSAGGATTYQWSINGANISTATHLNYTFTTAGTYSIALVASNGSCSNTYSQNVSINPAATQLALDSSINHCSDDGALMLDCQISNATAYTWQLNGNNIGTTQTLNVTQSGTYSLTVTDACGSTATDAVQVFIDTDCVYPGDLNHDNIVNYLDLLPMGLANGATGIARPNASPNFEGQPCPNWSGTQDNGSNYKHLDGNGDGIISASDANLITANYGQTHGVFTPPTFSGGGITSLGAQMGVSPTAFGNHTLLRIDLYLNNNINGNVTAYGAAFKVNYQFPNCIKVNNAYIDFTGSWLGTLGTDMTAVQRNKISNNQKSGNIEVSLTRLDHTNRSNYGKVGTLIADVDLVGTIDGALLSVLFSNQQLVISNGTFVPMGIVNSSFTIPNPIYPAVSLNSTALSGLLPCSGTAVTLTAAVSNCNSCTYVWKKGANVIASATTATINTTQAGTYTVIVTNANGSSSASVVLSVNQACVGSTGVAYCSPSITTTTAEWIKSVQFGTIDAPNITTSSPNGYGNYVDSKVFTLVPGTPATLTLQPDFSGSFKTEYWTVYADRNRDGDFDDLGELIWQKTTTDNQAFSKTYNIPAGISGTMRLRIVMKRNAQATSACENFAQGEVEDYTLRFAATSSKTDLSENETTPETVIPTLYLSPNPTSDQLNIEYQSDINTPNTAIRLYDLTGRLVFEETVLESISNDLDTQKATINIAHLPVGCYFVKIGNQTAKVVKCY